MKIAMYVPSWPPGSSANGIVTYAGQIVPALRRLGHEVFVLAPNHTKDEIDEHTIDLNKIQIPQSIWSRLQSWFFPDASAFNSLAERLVCAVLMLVNKYNLDVLEIEESLGWSSRIAEAKLVPVVVRLHGPWFLNGIFDTSARLPRNQRRIHREGIGIRTATLVTAPSVDVLRKVRAFYGFKLDLARVIRNPIALGTDVARWQLSSCDTNRILYVGRFDRRKGGDLVLRTFGKLAQLYPDLRLTFVGPDIGVREDDGRSYSFNQFIQKHLPRACWRRIDFCGQLPHAEVMALRTKHFLTIVASQFEILPYSVLEAMSLGCPIIATEVGGIPELITDQRNGLLVASQNVAALTAACQVLLTDHTLASTLGMQARKDCEEFFDSRQLAVETILAYEKAIEVKRSKDAATILRK
jgi:glycosyltransferase involved in cell wall biosynthesis